MNSDPCPISPENQSALTGNSWPRVRALFESALELEDEDRDLFLQNECGLNQELRQEVQALLDGYDQTGDFLETPLLSVKSLLQTDSLTPAEDYRQTGTRIGAYRLEQEIGRGGMGAVYLASRADSEFDKRVAIKLIRDGLENAQAIRRFRHERQILARLENPYIARLIDGGTTEAGLPYFVMEFVEGKPVNQYCETNSLTTRDRLNLFLKICSAVQYAHERNIIHRDLKPGNILVKKDGIPKLLDFGIAKILGADASGSNPEATIQGFRVVTPAYGSPEQMRGDPATVRSDIYSLGIVLYELLCGERPNLATFQNNSCLSERTQDAHLSVHLRAIVFSSIRLDPDERYPSIEAFAADIGRYLNGAPPLVASPALLETQDATEQISLAILPFRILGEQTKPFLASGITEALITRLSRIERLSIPATSAVLKYADGIEAMRAARELRVKYILEGSLHDVGECVRASVQLVFAEAGIAVWAAQIDNAEKDILKLEDSIAEQVASAVVPHLTGEERAELSKSGTTSGPAHEAYLRGRWHWNHSAGNQEHLAKALVSFMEAIAIDPKYAKAHAGVADYYLRLGLWGGVPPSESFAAAMQSAQTAVELEPALGEAHASLAFAAWAYLRDEKTAEKHFNLAAIRNPGYASAHHWFGLFDSARNRPELAIANLERAQKVDPNSAVIAAALGFVYYNARQFERALRLLLDAARELPKSAVMQEMLTWCHLRTGAFEKALETGRRAVELGEHSPAALSALAHAEAAAGHPGAAAALRDEIEELAKKRYVSGYDRASAFLATGQHPEALRCLEQALTDKDWWLCWIGVDPRWDPLRGQRRFQRLLPRNPRAARSNIRNAGLALACLLIAITGAAVWWSTRRPTPPFTNLKFTKLTSNGTADSAVIAPDGKTVVYTATDGGGTGIWRRDLATGRAVRLVPRLNGTVSELAVTGQGATVAFLTFPAKQPANRELYTVPLSGGAPVRVPGPFPGRVSLNSDGGAAAFYKSNLAAGTDELWVLNIKSGVRRLVESYKYPERFASTCRPAWSPDGKLIAYAAEQRDKDGFLVRLYVVDAATGSRHVVASPRWQWVQSLAWTGDKSALAAVGQESESSFQQVWYLPYSKKAPARRISNDLDSYIGVSLTARSSELVSVQAQTLSNIYVLQPRNLSHPIQITPGSGRYFDLSWMPDGRILYASDATGSADLWVMNADGSGERPVISGAGRNYAPIAAPDSKVIAFHSNRSGNWQVWRAGADGSHQWQLSAGSRDGNWPQFTVDGKFVLFHQTGLNGVFNLWRVPLAGGAAVQVTKALTMHPAVSRVDGRIAAWYSETVENPQWKLAVFAPEGGEPLRTYNPPSDAKPDTLLRWTPQGDAISFLDYAQGRSNIWLQPVDGSPARALTSFTSEDIYSFDWSRNGSLVYSRGLTTQDVVLIRDMNAWKGVK
jgi:serine/threonine protein kinase/Tol biopolymer transport system component/tetratricopeptide (TPR) repeat protein